MLTFEVQNSQKYKKTLSDKLLNNTHYINITVFDFFVQKIRM